MGLEADPAGMGILPMGCLDHKGYEMANPKNFYQHMILEVVSNKINHSTYFYNDLKAVANMQPRLSTRTFNPTARNAINQHMRMNVMYSKAKNARGKVCRVSELHVDNSASTFWELWSNAEEGQARPKYIAVPLPKPDEARFVWIDMAWPVRSILLPVAQNAYDDVQPHCVYVQLNFRRLRGKIATSGFYEDGNQGFSWLDGDKTYGLDWTSSPASMRVDIDMMYGTLLMPRERREVGNDLACLQLHRWDNVPYDWTSSDKNLNYEVDWQPRCINDDGVPLDRFVSIVESVNLDFTPRTPSKLAAILDTLVQFGLDFVPVVGPLLAYLGSEIISAIEDPARYETEKKIKERFGDGMTKPMLESMKNFRKFIKKKGFTTMSTAGNFTIAATYSAPTSRVFYSMPDLGHVKSGSKESSGLVDVVQTTSLDDLGSQPDEELDIFAETGFCDLMPMFTDQVEEFQQHPEVFTCEAPADLPVLKKTPEDEKVNMPVTKKDSEAEKSEDANVGAAPAGA